MYVKAYSTSITKAGQQKLPTVLSEVIRNSLWSRSSRVTEDKTRSVDAITFETDQRSLPSSEELNKRSGELKEQSLKTETCII